MKDIISNFLDAELHTKINTIVATICIIIALILGVRLAISVSGYNEKTHSYDSQISDLERDYANLSEYEGTVEQVKIKLYSASETGNKVCDLQNSYGNTKDFASVATQLDAYLSSDSSNYRTPWFYDENHAGKWTFHTNYQIGNTVIPCLWTYDVAGVMYEYVVGNYNADTNMFSNLEKHMTTQGTEYMNKVNVAPSRVSK